MGLISLRNAWFELRGYSRERWPVAEGKDLVGSSCRLPAHLRFRPVLFYDISFGTFIMGVSNPLNYGYRANEVCSQKAIGFSVVRWYVGLLLLERPYVLIITFCLTVLVICGLF